MVKGRIARAWLSYNAEVLAPSGVADGTTQHRETRRAFYAGAAGLLGVMLGNFESGTEPTPADLRMMDEIAEELRDFRRLIGPTF